MFKIARYGLILAGLVWIIYFINGQIKSSEDVKVSGDLVLLELRPRDPRALLLGDYMQLAYNQAGLPEMDKDAEAAGLAVISLDENNVATFQMLDDGSALEGNERRIVYARNFSGEASYGSERYYFQEGTAGTYQPARYGVLRVSPAGKAILTGLADEHFKILKPKPTP